MTVIAWDGRTLAADKMAGDQYVQSGTVTKIHRVRGCLVGYSGTAAIGRELLNWFETGADPDTFPAAHRDNDTHGTMLVITPEREILTYQMTPFPIKWDNPFIAIGGGREAALAVLYLGHTSELAVKVSSVISSACGNGIDTLQFKDDE